MWPAPVGDPGPQPGGVTSWPYSGDESQWPQGPGQAGTADTGPAPWSPPPAAEPTAPGAFGASPSPYDTGPQAEPVAREPYDDGSQGRSWQDQAGSVGLSQPGGAPATPDSYAPGQQNTGGPWAVQPGQAAPGVPSFPEWGPASAAGQPSGGETWPQAQAPAQGYSPADPQQQVPQHGPQHEPQHQQQYGSPPGAPAEPPASSLHGEGRHGGGRHGAGQQDEGWQGHASGAAEPGAHHAAPTHAAPPHAAPPQPDPGIPAAQPETYAEEAASPEAIRPGEPGDVPVWPPRLPGEPYPQGDRPAGTSWPPVHAYQGEPGATQAPTAPAGDRAGTSEPGGTSGDTLAATDTPEDTSAPGRLSTSGHPGEPGAHDQTGPGTPTDSSRRSGVPADERPPSDGASSFAGGAPDDGPGQTDTPADERTLPGGAARDAVADSVPPQGAQASHPFAPGHAGPPQGFGAEIAHAVTPIEGFPIEGFQQGEGVHEPDTRHEPGQTATNREYSTAQGEQRASYDRTTQPLVPPQPEEPLQAPTQTSNAPNQAQDSAPSGTPLGTQDGAQDGTPAETAWPPSQSPSEAFPANVPPAAVPPGAAPSDTPPTGPSASDGATGADSPDPSSGQMATTSSTTGSPSQPTGETPFAFTPVTPAKAGKPAPPPGFGPGPSAGGPSPAGNLPATLGPGSPPPSGGKVKRILMAAGAVVVVGAIGTAAYFAYSGEADGGHAAPTRAATTAPPSDAPRPSPTVASVILDSEQTDPKTLKPGEAFPDEKVTLAGRTYRRVKVDATDDCEKAAMGAFAQALTDQQCRRVLRATYVDGKRQYAVTTGIAVLPGKTEALAVDQAKNLGTNVWFRGLDGNQASGADKVSISGGYAAGMVWGRYIVFSYATYADGHTPDANDNTLGPISGAFRDNMAKVIEKRATR
ncbi:hypothetical protein AB0O28_12300 [Microbispora sp. NPDC088329]|uniref:hypothetical protein n=1 Tax=Microbispora sp. NPDC088329 TaxID=3154869 RepID=UPI00343ABFBE